MRKLLLSGKAAILLFATSGPALAFMGEGTHAFECDVLTTSVYRPYYCEYSVRGVGAMQNCTPDPVNRDFAATAGGGSGKLRFQLDLRTDGRSTMTILEWPVARGKILDNGSLQLGQKYSASLAEEQRVCAMLKCISGGDLTYIGSGKALVERPWAKSDERDAAQNYARFNETMDVRVLVFDPANYTVLLAAATSYPWERNGKVTRYVNGQVATGRAKSVNMGAATGTCVKK